MRVLLHALEAAFIIIVIEAAGRAYLTEASTHRASITTFS